MKLSTNWECSRQFLRAKMEVINEVIRKISAKSAHNVAARPHHTKSRRRASVPLIDEYQVSPVITPVQSIDTLAHKIQASADVISHLG